MITARPHPYQKVEAEARGQAFYLVIAVAAVLLVGCSTTPKGVTSSERVPPFHLVVASDERLNAEWRKMGGTNHVYGFFLYKSRTAWVLGDTNQVDRLGRPLPDFMVLGHELWHHLRGNFHDE